MAASPHPFYQLLHKAEVQERPVGALLELTHACNVDCEHCYLDLRPDKKIGALETAEWKRIFGELADEGCLFLTLSGGEVLVRRDWEEIALHARSLGFAIRFYTNGTLITEEVADRIAAVRPTGSKSACSAESPPRTTPSRVVAARSTRPSRGQTARARGDSRPSEVRPDEEERRRTGADQELAKALDCEMLFDIEVTPKNDGSLGPTELTAEGEAMLRAARVLYGGGTDVVMTTPREERIEQAPCAAGRRTVQIGPTGDVFPCTQWTTPLGNLRQTSFHELWNGSPMFKEIRAKRIGSFPTCARCELLGRGVARAWP